MYIIINILSRRNSGKLKLHYKQLMMDEIVR